MTESTSILIQELAIQLLARNPGGMRFKQLVYSISTKHPEINYNTILTQVGYLNENKQILRPRAGIYQLASPAKAEVERLESSAAKADRGLRPITGQSCDPQPIYSERIKSITQNERLQSILQKVESGDTNFSTTKINDIIAAYNEVIAYTFRLTRKRDNGVEKHIVGPWIIALYRARARKWADKGLQSLNIQINKAKELKRDPSYMGLYGDIYYEALHEERRRITLRLP